MRHRKTVTDKKLAANRLNAKRSTGPRTQRGTNASKFNAVKTGLFAKHIVIPVIDGEDSTEQFLGLLADLQGEFQPEGPAEDFYVAEMARSMWRLRRASLCEKGSVRNVAMWQQKRPPNGVEKSERIRRELSIVEKAREEYMNTRTLSPESYQTLLPLLKDTYQVDLQQRNLARVEPPPKPMIDDLFGNSLEWQSQVLQGVSSLLMSIGGEIVEDYYAGHALPPEAAMNQILRYENAAQKKFDWALQRLLESQQRRQEDQASASVQVRAISSATKVDAA
jgi:hypothetical protein